MWIKPIMKWTFSKIWKLCKLTVSSICNLSFFWATVFWILLLYDALPAGLVHLKISKCSIIWDIHFELSKQEITHLLPLSIKQHCRSFPFELQDSSSANPLSLSVLMGAMFGSSGSLLTSGTFKLLKLVILKYSNCMVQ